MSWIAVCVPLMVIGVAIATVPLVYATHHQHRYGHHEADPQRRAATYAVGTSSGLSNSDWTVCRQCTALVVDRATHERAVHQPSSATSLVEPA